MELRQLRYFLRAKETMNFTEAANSLFISQSTLSQQIKQLEDELGTPLFDRIGKRIRLTEAGALFSSYAAQSLSKANDGLELLKDLKDLKAGTIKIGLTYGLRHILTPAVIHFNSLFPKVKLQIEFGTSKELNEKLAGFQIDFMLSFEEYSTDDQYLRRELFQSPMALVCGTSSALKNKKSISLMEISKLPLALASKGYSTSQFISSAFDKSNLSPEVSIEINDIPTLLTLVKTGKWYTILTKTSISDEQGLHAIPIQGKGMTRTAMIISLKEVYETKAVKAFRKILENNSTPNARAQNNITTGK